MLRGILSAVWYICTYSERKGCFSSVKKTEKKKKKEPRKEIRTRISAREGSMTAFILYCEEREASRGDFPQGIPAPRAIWQNKEKAACIAAPACPTQAWDVTRSFKLWDSETQALTPHYYETMSCASGLGEGVRAGGHSSYHTLSQTALTSSVGALD